MNAQKKFTLKFFPYAAAFESWANVMVEKMNGAMTAASFGSAHFCFNEWVQFCNPLVMLLPYY
jgi:hypothetical protein